MLLVCVPRRKGSLCAALAGGDCLRPPGQRRMRHYWAGDDSSALQLRACHALPAFSTPAVARRTNHAGHGSLAAGCERPGPSQRQATWTRGYSRRRLCRSSCDRGPRTDSQCTESRPRRSRAGTGASTRRGTLAALWAPQGPPASPSLSGSPIRGRR